MSGPVDAALIAELFDRHAAALEFYAAQRTTLPQDCVQEAFLQLARQTSQPADPSAWLFRVVRNRALNAARAENRRTAHEDRAARQAADRHSADPGDAAALADLLQLVTDQQREIVVLRVWGQLTWQEIAKVVGISRSVAHRSYMQALQLLRKHLEPTLCPTTTQNSRP